MSQSESILNDKVLRTQAKLRQRQPLLASRRSHRPHWRREVRRQQQPSLYWMREFRRKQQLQSGPSTSSKPTNGQPGSRFIQNQVQNPLPPRQPGTSNSSSKQAEARKKAIEIFPKRLNSKQANRNASTLTSAASSTNGSPRKVTFSSTVSVKYIPKSTATNPTMENSKPQQRVPNANLDFIMTQLNAELVNKRKLAVIREEGCKIAQHFCNQVQDAEQRRLKCIKELALQKCMDSKQMQVTLSEIERITTQMQEIMQFKDTVFQALYDVCKMQLENQCDEEIHRNAQDKLNLLRVNRIRMIHLLQEQESCQPEPDHPRIQPVRVIQIEE